MPNSSVGSLSQYIDSSRVCNWRVEDAGELLGYYDPSRSHMREGPRPGQNASQPRGADGRSVA